MIEQRIIDDKVYSITILKELTEQDKEDLEETINKLKESKENIVQTSKFIIVNTHKTLEEIKAELLNDKIRRLFKVYRTNGKISYCIENINEIKEIGEFKFTDTNKKELLNKIILLEEAIEELEKYLLTLKSKAKEEAK